MDRIDLGRRLRALRSARGLSLAELEAGTGISSSFLSLVEGGKSDITIGRLVKLADYFEVDITELVAREGPDRGPFEVVRSQEGNILTSPGEGFATRFLGHPRWKVAARIADYEPGGTYEIPEIGETGPEVFHHHELFIYVIRGVFEIAGPGRNLAKLAKGDALFAREGIDRVANWSRGPGQLLAVGVATSDSPD